MQWEEKKRKKLENTFPGSLLTKVSYRRKGDAAKVTYGSRDGRVRQEETLTGHELTRNAARITSR